ncbi:MAG: flavodoxin family protein [Megasphaera sp.]|jgi:flavodoxin|nr:flavodoxin family protein [Megasphaera sp.]
MKGLVVYSPEKHATMQAAQAIYDELMIDKELATPDTMPAELSQYDIVFAGFWMDYSHPTADGKQVLQSLEDVNVALFCVVPDFPVTEQARESLRLNRELLNKNNLFLGGFICQAVHDANHRDKLKKGSLWGARQFSREMYYSLRS